MANKVVQLINEDNDNLYPLSGGVLSDSITTDMLKDSSVTSDKIDWTTSVVRPTATAYASIGDTAAYVFGDLVVVQFNFNSLQNIPPGTTVLTGFPAPVSQANVAGIVGNTANRFIINSGGELVLAGSGTQIPNGQIANFSTTYLLHATYE